LEQKGNKMQLSTVYAKIKELKQPIFQTRDIVALLNQTTTTTSKSLARLAKDKHLVRLNKGLWMLGAKIDPLILPSHLTAPFLSYISLQSALYHHGMIEQIPEIIYAVSSGRTKTFNTSIVTISIHHISPSLFFGYQTIGAKAIKIATPEKALFDFLYFRPAKTRYFAALPEVTIPKKFDRKLFFQWLEKIKSPSRRAMMENDFLKYKNKKQ
jgi:predicted transcriptional regulator of viral defense system